MAVNFKELGDRMRQLCSRCLLPRNEHKWEQDGDDWLLKPNGASTYENEESGETRIFCPTFIEGEPLVGVPLLMQTITEMCQIMDALAAAIGTLDRDVVWKTFGPDSGLMDAVDVMLALRIRSLEQIQEAKRLQNLSPDMITTVAQRVTKAVMDSLVEKDSRETTYKCSSMVMEQIRQHMHWCIGKDPEAIGGAMVALAIARQKLDKMYGK